MPLNTTQRMQQTRRRNIFLWFVHYSAQNQDTLYKCIFRNSYSVKVLERLPHTFLFLNYGVGCTTVKKVLKDFNKLGFLKSFFSLALSSVTNVLFRNLSRFISHFSVLRSWRWICSLFISISWICISRVWYNKIPRTLFRYRYISPSILGLTDNSIQHDFDKFSCRIITAW